MMLAQLQSLYPTASLVSELLQIYHGKYIVRASVQIEGVTRATGMAAADTVEAAEDQARTRALMVLGITPKPNITKLQTENFTDAETIRHGNAENENISVSVLPRITASSFSPTPQIISSLETQASTPVTSSVSPPDSKIDTYSQDFEQNLSVTAKPEFNLDTQAENSGIISSSQPENQPFPEEITSSNVTPFPQRSYSNPPEEVVTQPAPTTKRKKKSEPVDQSDDIAKIGVEMQRLGWTTQQGVEYLIKTYGKRSRHLLDPDELREFRIYLESQTTPVDPLAGF